MSARRRQAEPMRRAKRAERLTVWRHMRAPAPWLGWAAAAVALAAVLTWGLQWLRSPTTLPIRQVRLEGSFAHVSPDRVRALVAARIQGGFFGVNVTRVKTAVEALPWVERASVRRVWPHTLAITIREEQPLARWAAGGLVDLHGRLFTPNAKSYPPGLPVLAGPGDAVAALAARYDQVCALLGPLGLQAARLSMDKRHSWRLVLSNHIELVLGREDSLARLRRFAEVYAKVLAPRADDIARIDLRYTNGFAVAWRHADSNQPAGHGPVGNEPAGMRQG